MPDVVTPAPWPYPVRYDRETEAEFDVLVIGGGIAGCHAAINAARAGARVAVLDKGSVIRSGSGGAGCDHWHGAVGNPCCDITPEEFARVVDTYPFGVTTEYGNGITCYIMAKESYETLLDLEGMGARVRDTGDEFAGSEFRDDETKLMFAYDYTGAAHPAGVRLGVQAGAAPRVEAARGDDLRPGDGHQPAQRGRGAGGPGDVGATAVNVRTGEFYVFRAKATVLATAQPLRLWVFSTELQGFAGIHDDPNCAGDGCAMAWDAGGRTDAHGEEWSAPRRASLRGLRLRATRTTPGTPAASWTRTARKCPGWTGTGGRSRPRPSGTGRRRGRSTSCTEGAWPMSTGGPS